MGQIACRIEWQPDLLVVISTSAYSREFAFLKVVSGPHLAQATNDSIPSNTGSLPSPSSMATEADEHDWFSEAFIGEQPFLRPLCCSIELPLLADCTHRAFRLKADGGEMRSGGQRPLAGNCPQRRPPAKSGSCQSPVSRRSSVCSTPKPAGGATAGPRPLPPFRHH